VYAEIFFYIQQHKATTMYPNGVKKLLSTKTSPCRHIQHKLLQILCFRSCRAILNSQMDKMHVDVNKCFYII